MRTIERTNQFKRDFKRLSKGPDANSLRPKLADVVNMRCRFLCAITRSLEIGKITATATFVPTSC
jgi:hypothetical protein